MIKKLNIKKIILFFTVFLFLGVSSVLAHSFLTKNDIGINIPGGQRIGVWFDNYGQAYVRTGDFGCCSPFCVEMYEIECSEEFGYAGTFHKGNCEKDVPECKEGCCIPNCHMYPKIQCEGDYGIEGTWYDSECCDMNECEIGCCDLDGLKFEEMKAPCESAEGSWTQGECVFGYSVELESISSTTMVGVKITQVINYDIWTCSNTPEGLWLGTMTSKTTSNLGGEIDVIEDEVEVYLDLSEGYYENVETFGGEISYVGRVEGDKVTIEQYAPGLVDHFAEGIVEPGAEQCKK